MTTYDCECGVTMKLSSVKRHRTSAGHKNRMIELFDAESSAEQRITPVFINTQSKFDWWMSRDEETRENLLCVVTNMLAR